jgi:hypothetical protein
VKATPSRRLLFQLAPSMPNTDETEFGLWPTPKGEVSGPDYARTNRPESGGDDLATAVGRTKESGSLNPAWVEWLMGYPTAWTALTEIERAK